MYYFRVQAVTAADLKRGSALQVPAQGKIFLTLIVLMNEYYRSDSREDNSESLETSN